MMNEKSAYVTLELTKSQAIELTCILGIAEYANPNKASRTVASELISQMAKKVLEMNDERP